MKQLVEFISNEVQVNEVVLDKFNSEDQFMELAVELSKEALTIQNSICGLYKNAEGIWEQDEAVFAGLMLRLNKLYLSFIENTCNRKYEIVSIICRCIIETAINLKYLINNKHNYKRLYYLFSI